MKSWPKSFACLLFYLPLQSAVISLVELSIPKFSPSAQHRTEQHNQAKARKALLRHPRQTHRFSFLCNRKCNLFLFSLFSVFLFCSFLLIRRIRIWWYSTVYHDHDGKTRHFKRFDINHVVKLLSDWINMRLLWILNKFSGDLCHDDHIAHTKTRLIWIETSKSFKRKVTDLGILRRVWQCFASLNNVILIER